MRKFFNNIEINGIIQVGANSGQEVPFFEEYTNNIILIEPIKNLANFLKNTYPNYLIINCALGSSNSEMEFHLASNNGESSSLLKPINHINYYPDIKFEDRISIKVNRFDFLVNEMNIDIKTYNVLVTDTQGYDLEVIKGFGDYITNFNLIIAEYINSNLYENDNCLEDISNYLNSCGFNFIEKYGENLGSGNAVFIKNIL